MPVQEWKCSYCEERFETEGLCLEHEQSHSTKMPCTHVGLKDSVDAVCHTLDRADGTELTFKWQRGSKEVKQKFAFSGSVQLRATGVLPEVQTEEQVNE